MHGTNFKVVLGFTGKKDKVKRYVLKLSYRPEPEYNQSTLLAHYISKNSDSPFIVKTLCEFEVLEASDYFFKDMSKYYRMDYFYEAIALKNKTKTNDSCQFEEIDSLNLEPENNENEKDLKEINDLDESPLITEESVTEKEPTTEEEPIIKEESIREEEPKEEPIIQEESIREEEPKEEPITQKESLITEEEEPKEKPVTQEESSEQKELNKISDPEPLIPFDSQTSTSISDNVDNNRPKISGSDQRYKDVKVFAPLPPYPGIMMEYVTWDMSDNSDLYSVKGTIKNMPEEFIIRILYSALSALKELHLLGIVHRDIKARNFMMTSDLVVKLGFVVVFFCLAFFFLTLFFF
jgi:hypothetical protein